MVRIKAGPGLRRRGLLALALLVALTCACSRLSIGWRLAPYWLKHEAVRWLDAGVDERGALDRDVDAYLHRLALTLAPQAAGWSRHLAKLVAAGRDKEAVDSLFDGGILLWRGAKELGVDPAADWLARRPQERAKALRRQFDKELRRDQGRPAFSKEAADRAKRLREGLADWIGDLREEQQDLVVDFAAHAAYPDEAMAADRRAREQAILAALAASADRRALGDLLRRWWLDPEADRKKACVKAVQEYRLGLRATLCRLAGTLSAAQRDRLVRRLNALAQDLDAISRRATLEGD